MENESQKSKLSQLLERLQEESWQLELLISGFAIFLVSSMKEPLQDSMTAAQVASSGLPSSNFLIIPFMILIGAWLFLLVNLIMHVVLRGFWIAAIGLRYISGDIDFERLNMAPKFDRYLRRRIPSFDLFIEKLEKLCSVVFVFTFLIIFSIISLGLFVLFMFFVTSIVKPFVENNVSEYSEKVVIITIIGSVFFTGLIYFIDFITLGWLKKIKWLSYVYYPIYRFYSIITLSFLYRPLYYNLIDNKFGKRVGFFIVPYIIAVTLITSIHTDSFLYYPERSSALVFENDYYASKIDKHDRLNSAVIPDKVITTGFLELFIPYFEKLNDEIDFNCPDIVADKYLGTKFSAISFGRKPENATSVDSLLLCVSSVYKIRLDDSLLQNVDYMFYKHEHANEPGLLTFLDIEPLDRGKHILNIETARLFSKGDSLHFKTKYIIPFWKD